MDSDGEPLAQRIATVLPFVMPAIGGAFGVLYVNVVAPAANPLILIGAGALLGWILARLIVKPLESIADRKRSKR